MPIVRTPMVDDDGSGMTGTIINNAWKQEFYNQIDGVVVRPQASIHNSDTGTINNWAPTGLAGKSSVVFWYGTAPTTITGIAGGVDGQIIVLHNFSPTPGIVLSFSYYSGASTDGNKIMLLTQSSPTPVAVGGYITLAYNGAWGRWFQVGHEQGQWITSTYLASDYYGSGSMIWTVEAGDVWQRQYRLSGSTLHWALYVSGTAITGTPGVSLITKIPGGFTARSAFPTVVGAYGTAQLPGAYYICNGSTVEFRRDLASAVWPSGNMHLFVNAVLEVA